LPGAEDWKLETGNWRLETGDWRLETIDYILSGAVMPMRCSVLASNI
jgi:hypothetical protein